MGALKHFFIGFLKEPIKKNIVISKWVWLLLLDFNHHHMYMGRGCFEIETQVFRVVLSGNHLLIIKYNKMKHSHTISVQEKKFQMTSLGP